MAANNRVYKYGAVHYAKCPAKTITNMPLISEQMHLAHKYRNKLVEIERARQAARKEQLLKVDPVFAELDEQYEQKEQEIQNLIDQLNAKRAAARSRIADPKLQAAIKQAKQERNELGKARSAQRLKLLYQLSPTYAELDPKWQAAKEGLSTKEIKERAESDEAFKQLQESQKAAYKEADQAIYAEVEAEYGEQMRQARKDSGVDWGTYQEVEERHEQARKTSRGPMRFVPKADRSTLTVHIQGKPLYTEDLYAGTSNFLRLSEPPAAAYDKKTKGRKRLQYQRLHFRIKGDEQKKPIWAEIPIVLHRPLPPKAKIIYCKLHRKRIGTDYRYEVHFTLQLAEGAEVKPRATSGAVGIDLGYRRLDGRGLRVAYWVGDDGRQGELLIPEHKLGAIAKTKDLRSIRDKSFDHHKLALASWLRATESESLPEWLKEQTTTVSNWRSTARLAALVIYWRQNRFAGDEQMYDLLNEWRKQDKHLLLWQRHEEQRLLDWRRETYRAFAAELRKQYSECRIEELDLRALLAKPTAEEESVDGALRHHSRTAALSELVLSLKQFGPECHEIDGAYSTRLCHQCGHINSWADQSGQILTCENCHETWDQDRNAAVNLLRAKPCSPDRGRRSQASEEQELAADAA